MFRHHNTPNHGTTGHLRIGNSHPIAILVGNIGY
ncbi:hypothetical protein ARTHRO9V_100140 [Arthrobacter sp. 9V]|nr:hypothetical protein ARTHRO9V_100140 [Arthrobacter sp. 9V]